MAIEDEIINISDIDVGTEILNNDKLIIETNNGTKLLAFKDLVIGEENITFKDKLVQGARSGKSTMDTDLVEGYNILTSDTTAGHVTKYSDISGTVELGRFNYIAATEFAGLSTTITANQLAIGDANIEIAKIQSLLASTDNDALNTISLITKPVNFIVTQNGAGTFGPSPVFTDKTLDPTTTNSNVSFANSPFKITYPSAASGTYADGFVLFILEAFLGGQGTSADMKIYLLLDGDTVAEADFFGAGVSKATINKALYVKRGQTVTLAFNKDAALEDGSNFSGIRFS